MVKNDIQRVENFPKQGVTFFDWLPILTNWRHFGSMISFLSYEIEKMDPQPDILLAIEARGFLLATALSLRLGKGVIVARRPKKLPGNIISTIQTTEYGQDALAIQCGHVKNKNVLVIDDIIATGGTYDCVKALIELEGGNCLGLVGVIDLPYCRTAPLDNYYTIFTANTPESELVINESISIK